MGDCMIGPCEICGEQMDEDDWMFTGKIMHHETCNATKGKTTKHKNKLEALYDMQEKLSVLGIISRVNERKLEIVINMSDNLDFGKSIL